MSTQISLQLSERMISVARECAETKGFDNIQDFIRETLREKLFEEQNMNSFSTYLASEKALAKAWLAKEEDKAWQHLQKEI